MKNTIVVTREMDIEDIRRIQKEQRADRRVKGDNKRRDTILDRRELRFC